MDTSDTADASVTVSRDINAAARVVFSAWTNPSVLASWLLPDGCTPLESSVEARQGGRYLLKFGVPGGGSQALGGVYREFIPDHRIVKTWILHGPDSTSADVVKVVTAVFKELAPEVTQLTLTHQGEQNADVRKHLAAALIASLAKLDAWATHNGGAHNG